jgi:hypothetical protein
MTPTNAVDESTPPIPRLECFATVFWDFGRARKSKIGDRNHHFDIPKISSSKIGAGSRSLRGPIDCTRGPSPCMPGFAQSTATIASVFIFANVRIIQSLSVQNPRQIFFSIRGFGIV